MTPVRFSIAVVCAIAGLAARTPPHPAAIAVTEYQARRTALAKAIGSDALFIARAENGRGHRGVDGEKAADLKSFL
jgi:hypothetical protein